MSRNQRDMTYARPDDVLRWPQACAAQIVAEYPLAKQCDVVAGGLDFVTFEIELMPYLELCDNFPVETVRITVRRDGDPIAVPIGPPRAWKHRYADLYNGLCLWYPLDPTGVRWEWRHGIVEFVAIVHRHLQAEEHLRRSGEWPVEDVPHEPGDHRIRSLLMRLHAGEELR